MCLIWPKDNCISIYKLKIKLKSLYIAKKIFYADKNSYIGTLSRSNIFWKFLDLLSFHLHIITNAFFLNAFDLFQKTFPLQLTFCYHCMMWNDLESYLSLDPLIALNTN